LPPTAVPAGALDSVVRRGYTAASDRFVILSRAKPHAHKLHTSERVFIGVNLDYMLNFNQKSFQY
jgi:hypothetical protein